MSSAYDAGMKEGASEILGMIFPKEGIEEYFGREMTDDEWFDIAHSLAANLEISISRNHFNDSFYDMLEDRSEMLGVENPEG